MRNLFAASTIAVAVCLASGAQAQEITSTVRGTVTAGTAPIAGATVTVTHEPSGTVTTVTTGADGAFSASGQRVGGPFTVKVAASGYQDYTVTDIQLTAGQPLRLPIAIESAGQEIVITGTRARFTEVSPGPITVLNREKIEGVASINRDLRDAVRRDPFATLDPTAGGTGGSVNGNRGVSIVGQNPRLNKFSVDGQRFTDTFGLNNGGLPTQRGPVPLDAVEQLSVKIVPADVSEGDFAGGAINVITRSGGNQFHGSGFYTYTDDGLTGDKTKPSTANPTGKVNLNYKSKNYGGFLSGPIVKDKLFFAVAYEHLNETTPISFGTAGFPNVVPNVTGALLDQVSAIARSRYGYDTLGLASSFREKDEKVLAKLDWNVTDGQRLTGTYIYNKGTLGQDPGFSTVLPLSPALSYASNLYYRPETVHSGTVQLNSDWASNFHTEIRGNYRSYDLIPTSLGAYQFGQVQVCTDPTNPAAGAGAATNTCSQGTTSVPGAARLYFGPDQFRQANLVKNRNIGVDVTLRWEVGNHSFKFNAAYNRYKVLNVFVQNAIGGYYFDSLGDFQAGNAGMFSLGGSTTGDLDDIAAGFKYQQYNFGLQDSWDVNDHLNVTFGVRADLFGMHDSPPLNTAFVGRYGFPNTYRFSGKLVTQPRFGATWRVTDQLTARAGFGLFAGGSPDVFIGNSFSVPGVFNNGITINRNTGDPRYPIGFSGVPQDAQGLAIAQAALNGVTGNSISPLVLNYLRTNTAAIALAATNSMSRNYQPESVWKASLSLDYKPDFDWLGRGWTFGADAFYGWTNYAPYYTDLRLVQVGTMPDGRPRYLTSTLASSNTDLFLSNTKLGHSFVGVVRVDKRFDFGLDLGVSYTFQSIKDVNPANGTTSSGSYGQTAMVDPNRATYGTSIYQIRNSIKFTVDFDHAFFGDYKTRFSLFGERRSGSPYSLTMNDPAFSNSHSSVFGVSGQANRFLLYVPNVSSITADPLVSYDSAATFTAFQAFVQNKGLKQGIVHKNTERSPTYFKIDLHVGQELPLPLVDRVLHGARVELFADMENVLNFIDKDWGSFRQVTFPYLATIVNVACVGGPANGNGNCPQYRYSNFQNPNIVNVQRFSLWGVRIGARVKF